MKKFPFFFALSLIAFWGSSVWSQVADVDQVIYDIPEPSDACHISEFFLTDQPEPFKIDAEVLVSFEENSLVFEFDLPAFNGSNELKECYLSDEFDLRRVPNVTISLDPDHGHGVYYNFIVDSEGRRQDLRVDDESWITEWTAVTKLEGGRFHAEVRIPVGKIAPSVTDGDFWGFNVSLNGVFPQGTYHTTPMGLRSADAANFGHLLFNGSLGKGKISQLRTSLPDIHVSMKQESLEANRAMCGPGLAELSDEMTALLVGEDLKLKNGTELTVLGLDNDPIIRSDYPFFYEKYSNSDLQRLRKQYSLEEIIAPGKNDFEQILLLNEWLVEHVPFGSPPPMRPQALQILYHGLNGQTFYCTYVSFTLMQMYCSLGFTARKMTSVGHGTMDVWSNYWRKWMQVDPSRNSYFRLAGTAVPLNSNEIRREYYRNGGVDMEMVFGTEQRAERVTFERRDKDGAYRYRQDGYAWVAYKSRNNFFEVPFAYWNYDYLIAEDEYNENRTWQANGKTDVRETLGTRTRRVGDIFWTLNQAHIHLYDQGSSGLEVQLETHTPNFESFEISVDNGEWQSSDPILSWELHKGQNFLKARSRNKFGVAGPEHKIVLKVD